MSHATATEDPRYRWALAGLTAGALLLHVQFSAVDVRPAPDLGHYWSGAMAAVRAGHTAADTPYATLIAALWSVTDRSQAAFEGLEALWLASLVVGLGLAGRAVGGLRGLVTAASAALIFPIFPTGARTHWIHHPEAGAAALALGLAAGEPTLARGLLLGLVAGLGAAVRPSAAVWLAIPLIVWAWRARGPLRLLPWAPFAIGILPLLPSLPGYARMRVEGRAATSAAVGNPLPLLAIQTGLLPGLLASGLAVLSFAAAAPSDPTSGVRSTPEGTAGAGLPGASPRSSAVAGAFGLRAEPVRIAAATWVAAGLVVVLATGAGPDNVPTVFVGLAVLAGAGAARIPERPLAAGLVLLALIGPATQLHRVDLGLVSGWPAEDHALNWLVPRSDGVSGEALAAAAREACPPDDRCRVLVQRGLVHPSWEDDGSLALFLAHVDDVETVAMPAWRRGAPDVGVAVTCRGPVPDPSARFPGIDERFVKSIAGLAPITEVAGNGCVRVFYGEPR